MAKPACVRLPVPGYLAPRGNILLLLISLISIVSLLTYQRSRRFVAAAPDFEGFNADDIEYDDDVIHSHTLNPSSSVAPTVTQSNPESHHGPPPSSASEFSLTVGGQSSAEPHASSSLETWDEDEFEGFPYHASDPSFFSSAPSEFSPAAVEAVDASPVPSSHRRWHPSSYAIEIVCVFFLICFPINFFIGKRENELIALCWASQFATKGSIFDKNFSLLGSGDGKEDAPLLLKEGQDVFKFYASGRRYCQGMVATMELCSRHDLVARITDVLFRKKDTITFEVMMNENAMDHVVLAVARRKIAKAMHKEARDLQRFANTMLIGPSGRTWVAEDLMVLTESKEIAGDLITDAVIDQVLGVKAIEHFGDGFISLHFSDQHPGYRKKLLLLKFALPRADNMSEMTRLVLLVPYFIDLIGRYKLSSQARAKTEASRAKTEQEAIKETQIARQEALQRKKAGKKKLMEAEAKLSAEAARRKEEKERSQRVKKHMPKVKMLRPR